MFEYEVVELAARSVSGTHGAKRLRELLNEYARDGWQLRQIVGADVKGPLGKNDGLLVTFERRIA